VSIFDCHIKNEERLNTLLKLLDQTRIEALVNEYDNLPEDLIIHLIDKSSINHNFQQLHSQVRKLIWVLIDDGSDNIYPDIYETAIHHAKWDTLLWQCEKELLFVIEKCCIVDNLIVNSIEDE